MTHIAIGFLLSVAEASDRIEVHGRCTLHRNDVVLRTDVVAVAAPRAEDGREGWRVAIEAAELRVHRALSKSWRDAVAISG
jgi:hypothetical protein